MGATGSVGEARLIAGGQTTQDGSLAGDRTTREIGHGDRIVARWQVEFPTSGAVDGHAASYGTSVGQRVVRLATGYGKTHPGVVAVAGREHLGHGQFEVAAAVLHEDRDGPLATLRVADKQVVGAGGHSVQDGVGFADIRYGTADGPGVIYGEGRPARTDLNADRSGVVTVGRTGRNAGFQGPAVYGYVLGERTAEGVGQAHGVVAGRQVEDPEVVTADNPTAADGAVQTQCVGEGAVGSADNDLPQFAGAGGRLRPGGYVHVAITGLYAQATREAAAVGVGHGNHVITYGEWRDHEYARIGRKGLRQVPAQLNAVGRRASGRQANVNPAAITAVGVLSHHLTVHTAVRSDGEGEAHLAAAAVVDDRHVVTRRKTAEVEVASGADGRSADRTNVVGGVARLTTVDLKGEGTARTAAGTADLGGYFVAHITVGRAIHLQTVAGNGAVVPVDGDVIGAGREAGNNFFANGSGVLAPLETGAPATLTQQEELEVRLQVVQRNDH